MSRVPSEPLIAPQTAVPRSTTKRRRFSAAWLAAVLALVLVAGCAGPRGAVTLDPGLAGVGSEVPVLVASARAPAAAPAVYGPERAPLSFSRFVVSVPPDRKPGSIAWPGGVVDPRKDFVTLSEEPIGGNRAFVGAINRAVAQAGRNEVIVFVHGYNTTFAEGLYRQSQLAHDFALPAVSVNFSWPSGAKWDRYPYDKESAVIAAADMSRTLALVARSSATDVVVACHSMGCFLTLESLREMSLRHDRELLKRLKAVVMLAPDIDIDLFRARLHEIGAQNIPMYVFASRRDQALRLSARLHGGRPRVGMITDPTILADLPVTVIDVSAVRANKRHSTLQTSPLLSALFQGLDDFGMDAISSTLADRSLVATTIAVAGQASAIALRPLDLK